ncbi:MAG: MBL fold metallo-hydrolase [Balneolaceae bacterium]
MNILSKILLWLLGLFATFVLVVVIVGWSLSEPGYDGPKSKYFNGERFENPGDVEVKSFLDVIKWALTNDPGEWNEISPDEVDFGEKPKARIGDSLVVTYINHSTFLIQTDSLNILTDPIWSGRASPFSFAGPKRMTPPGIHFKDLPHIDLVVISHNHYDHLDISTLKNINERFGSTFITPFGVGQYLNSEGILNTKDLGWWEEHNGFNFVNVVSVPAQHFSSRGLFDRDNTLWAGYILKTRSGNIYFAGDTGYGEFFKEIGERYEIKLGLIPIGAYKPRWFMSPVHLSPQEAILAHQDIGAEISLGMHYGTFPLADDGRDEPINDFYEAMESFEGEKPNFRVLGNGKSLIVD